MIKNIDNLKEHIPVPLNEEKLASIERFMKIVDRLFAVYLDDCYGHNLILSFFKNNADSIAKQLNLSIEEMDRRMIIYGDGDPYTGTELLRRSKKQVKDDNSYGGYNDKSSLHHCITNIYNQWKLMKGEIGIDDDKKIPIFAYMNTIRNRLQHELFDINGIVRANALIELDSQITNHLFPRFADGDKIILSNKDCQAIIQEIRIQLKSLIGIDMIC